MGFRGQVEEQIMKLNEIVEREQEYTTGDNLTPEQLAFAMKKFEGAEEVAST